MDTSSASLNGNNSNGASQLHSRTRVSNNAAKPLSSVPRIPPGLHVNHSSTVRDNAPNSAAKPLSKIKEPSSSAARLRLPVPR